MQKVFFSLQHQSNTEFCCEISEYGKNKITTTTNASTNKNIIASEKSRKKNSFTLQN